MSAQPPEGLRLMGLGAAVLACVMLYVTSAVDAAAVGGAAGLVGMLAAVAAEALWNGRRWAFRASILLAIAYFGVMLLSPVLIPGAAPIAAPVLVLTGGMVIAALFYIRRQIAALYPAPGPTRIAVPGRTP